MSCFRSFVLYYAGWAVGIILLVIQIPLVQYTMAVGIIGAFVILAGCAQTMVFFRCPHCHARLKLDRWSLMGLSQLLTQRYCHYCGKPVW